MSIAVLDGMEPNEGLFPDALIDSFGRDGLTTHRQLSPIEQNTQTIANAILNPEFPFSAATLEPSRVNCYNPASEAMEAGDIIEKKSILKIKAMEAESNKIIESIDLLLDLSRELGTLNSESPKLTQKIKDINQKLQEKGINLIEITEGKEIDKEQLAGLKTLTGSHVDKLRTQIQQIFTKMQTEIQNITSMNDSIKKMLSEQSDQIRKILERSIKH